MTASTLKLVCAQSAEPTISVSAQPNSVLSALEWMTVSLAKGDPLSSVTKPGPIASAFRLLFGRQNPNRLANARLEALRRISVLSWHRGFAVEKRDVNAFTSAGFSVAQYEKVVTTICQMRDASSQR